MSGPRLYRVLFAALACLVGTAVHAAEGLDAARELARAGRNLEALERLDALPEAQAGDPQARFLRGVLLAELGRSADAIAEFDALTEDFPRLAEPFNNLAVLYAAEGRYEEARDALLVAIQNKPSYATAHENLGDIYAKMAALSYSRAAEIDADNASAREKGARVERLFDESSSVVAPARRTPPPPAAPRPIPAPAPAQSAATGDAVDAGDEASDAARRDEALALVESWAAAWSAQDAERYLAHYAPSFEPADGRGRAAWERVRRERLARPRFIVVTVTDLDLELGVGDGAWASFEQTYESDSYQDQVRKRLDLVMTAEGWKIAGERSLP